MNHTRFVAPSIRAFRCGRRCGGANAVWAAAAGLLLSWSVAGCQGPPPAPPDQPPPKVRVSTPLRRQITDYQEYPGHTEAVNNIVLRARVSGYLDKVYYNEQEMLKKGFEVKEGEPLFEIDRRTYEAEFNRAQANVAQAEARLVRLEADFRRAENLIQSHSISQAEFDQVRGDRAEAQAAVGVAQAALASAKLNLDFTIVTAPLSGRISRRLVDPGNLVRADDTALTTIVSLDPIYAYFDVDERTMLKIRALIRAGKIKSAREREIKIGLALADQDQPSREGVIDFIDNQVDPASGTLRLRGVFDNADRMLSPGLFVRLRVPIGEQHEALLVSERALGSNQGQKYVYVVQPDQTIAQRRVEIKTLGDPDGLCVVTAGDLTVEDRVVLDGLQRVRPGMKVAPELIPMVGKAEAAEDQPATAESQPQPAGQKPQPAQNKVRPAADRPAPPDAKRAARDRPAASRPG